MLQLPESKFILKMLRRDLAPDLYYHTIEHTLDVYDRVVYIAENENIDEFDLKLLLIAALYHDCGYLTERDHHEVRSCAIVKDVLPRYGYSEKDIERICTLIMSTKLPQEPTSLLEQIICDADLDYLGRADFFDIGNRLFREMLAVGRVDNEQEWDAIQIDFLKKHRYFTATANTMRSQKKQENLNVLLLKHRN